MASICRFDLVAKRHAGYAVSMEVARTGRAKTALLETLVWPAKLEHSVIHVQQRLDDELLECIQLSRMLFGTTVTAK